MKKILFMLLTAAYVSFVLIACQKGDVGPAGPEGPAGPAGPQGVPGTANVTQFNVPGFSHDGAEKTFTFNLSKTDFEKSLLYVYVKTGAGFWYPLPGNVTSSYDYRIYFSTATATTSMMLTRVAGTGSQTFTNMRIVVIPAANQQNARPAGLPDMQRYEEVATYYNLPL